MQIKVFIRAGGGVRARKGHRLLLPSAPWHIPMREGILPAWKPSTKLRHKQSGRRDRGRNSLQKEQQRWRKLSLVFPLPAFAFPLSAQPSISTCSPSALSLTLIYIKAGLVACQDTSQQVYKITCLNSLFILISWNNIMPLSLSHYF